eukprot:scaffold743_cov267-Pinguiococcus_pyrenoidosus.AAC.32
MDETTRAEESVASALKHICALEQQMAKMADRAQDKTAAEQMLKLEKQLCQLPKKLRLQDDFKAVLDAWTQQGDELRERLKSVQGQIRYWGLEMAQVRQELCNWINHKRDLDVQAGDAEAPSLKRERLR